MTSWYVLERKFAIRILLMIADNPGITQTDIMRMSNEGERTRYVRIKNLMETGLIFYETGRMHNSKRLYLTPKGQRVVAKMRDVVKIMEEEE